jgi:hypothetical protein
LHPNKNSNKRLNSAYARLRADAIADPLWRFRNIFFSAILPVILWSQTNV